MDILFNNLGIFKTDESVDAYATYVDSIFQSDGNILSTYNFIRSNNIPNEIDKINLLKTVTIKYIEKKIKLIQSPTTCLNVLTDINNKMLKIRMLFEYLKNRKSQDLYLDFLNEYYSVCLENINVFVLNIFKQLVDISTPQYIQKQAEQAFDIFIQGLKYHFENWESTKKTDIAKKEIVSNTLLLHNKFGSRIIFEFGNVVQLFFKSHQSLKFTDLVDDFKLSIKMRVHEKKIVQHIVDSGIDCKFVFDNLISKLPIIPILSSVNIYVCDPIYYDIVHSQIINNKTLDLDIYLEKLITGIESNIIITQNKYKSEHLFLDIAKTFKVLSKMLNIWSELSTVIKLNIIQTINSILAQDDILINYIVTSMVIFVKKININNLETLKDLVAHTSKCIALSNKESVFLDLLYQNLQSNIIKSKITNDLFEYMSVIIDNFDSNESNYIKIKKFLHEIEINLHYNTEISSIKIKSNKSVPVNMSLANTILINKEVWKSKYKSIPKIKIPDQIAIYFKAYEKFYTLKHNFRSVEWCYENSTIEIDINKSLISGSIIPMSILVNIALSKTNGISYSDLITILEIDEDKFEPINKYLDLLVVNNIVTEQNKIYKIETNLPSLINLSKLTIGKVKVSDKDEDSYDIGNSTDCYVVKSLKSISPQGLELGELTDKVNQLNKYFKVEENYIKTRCDILINKNHLVFKNSAYVYDV